MFDYDTFYNFLAGFMNAVDLFFTLDIVTCDVIFNDQTYHIRSSSFKPNKNIMKIVFFLFL